MMLARGLDAPAFRLSARFISLALCIALAPANPESRGVLIVLVGAFLLVGALLPVLSKSLRLLQLRLLQASDGFQRLKAVDILVGVGDLRRDYAMLAVSRLSPPRTSGKNAGEIAMLALREVRKRQRRHGADI